MINIIIIISFTQGIYNYIPETNHVPRVRNAVSVLWLQHMAHVMLLPTINVSYFGISIFRIMYAVLDRACSSDGEGTGVYRVLVGKPEGKRPLGRPRCRW
jgi:hypothetical protein